MRCIVIVLSILAPVAVTAQEPKDVHSGNRWQAECKSGSSFCNSYISGLVDMHVSMVGKGSTPLWCAPDGVTYGQAVKIVTAYGEKHPAKLHLRYAELAAIALAEAFPCDRGTSASGKRRSSR